MRSRVYVDAKIVGRHELGLPKKTYVGYVVENNDDLQGVTVVKADETDDAELHAIAFAIRQLKDRLDEFTVVCDHESVVSVIKRKDMSAGRKRPILVEVLRQMESNPSVEVELLANNPAHRLLNKHIAALLSS